MRVIGVLLCPGLRGETIKGMEEIVKNVDRQVQVRPLEADVMNEELLVDIDYLCLGGVERLLTQKQIDNASRLVYIGLHCTGLNPLDGLDIPGRITVSNVSGYATKAVGQLVFAYLEHAGILGFTGSCSLMKKIEFEENILRHANSDVVFGGKRATTEVSIENISDIVANNNLSQKKIGVIGLGDIGSYVAKQADRLDAKISYYSPHARNSEYEMIATIDELFHKSHIVVICCALNNKTRNMIKREAIESLSRNRGILINIARAEIIEMNAWDFLFSDEFQGKLYEDVSFFRSRNNAITTPHIGFNTIEAAMRKDGIFLHNFSRYILSVQRA